METLGIAMLVQQERDRVTDRVNKQGWMIASLEKGSRGRLKDALTRAGRTPVDC